MQLERRRAYAWSLVLAALLIAELSPALSLPFIGDDFELFSLARIGRFSPEALFVPHRGFFLKPVMNASWAVLVRVMGTNTFAWYALALAIHVTNALLLAALGAALLRRVGRVTPRGGDSIPPTRAAGQVAPPETSAASPPGAQVMSPQVAVSLSPHGLPFLAGLIGAGIWAVHDRLLEPVFSLAG